MTKAILKQTHLMKTIASSYWYDTDPIGFEFKSLTKCSNASTIGSGND